MARPSALKPLTMLIAAVVLAAIAVGAVALLRNDPWGENSTVPPPEPIGAKLIAFDEVQQIPTGMKEVAALAVAPDGTLFVGGDHVVQAFDAAGAPQGQPIALPGPPKCLAVGLAEDDRPGRLYVGLEDHVAVFERDGRPAATWKSPAAKAIFTSIAASERHVFVADAGNRIVWRYDLAGNLEGPIGERNPAKKIYGFVLTNEHFFDLAVGPDDLLYVVNPRLLRIEAYSFAGELRSHWGEGSPKLDGFFGCCNPSQLAALADGRFVTVEKGLTRVKVYSAAGKLESVVAGPQHFSETPVDLAVDEHGRVLLLDPASKSVRVFAPNKKSVVETTHD